LRRTKNAGNCVKVIPENEGDLDLTGIRNINDAMNSGAAREISAIRRLHRRKDVGQDAAGRGQVSEKIVEVADDENCDLIVMGSDRKSWFSRIFSEKIVEKVIEMAHCPVLVVGA